MFDTERLHIRRFTLEDWQGLHAYLSDPKVVEFEPYPPIGLERSREVAAHFAASPDFWAVCRKDGTLAGQVYLAEKEQRTWEAGFVFHRAHQGKGYATESVRRLMEYAFMERDARRIMAICNPVNTPSWRLLERLGFRREGHLLQNIYFREDEAGQPVWLDTYLYAVLQSEWL